MFDGTNNVGFSGQTGGGAPPPPVLPAWLLDGNTVGSVKFIGTIDNFDFPIRTNNTELARFYANGRISLGVGATIVNADEVSIGGLASSSGGQAIAVGYSSIAVGGGVAVGYGAQSLINRGVAVGFGAISSSQGVSVGYATSTNDRGVAIGYLAVSTSVGVSIGESASAVGGVSIKGTGTAPSHTAIQGIVSGGGMGITIQGFAEATDNIAIGFRTRATANGAMIFGRSVDNATFLTNSTIDSVGFGWSEATPTVLFAKTSDQYISGSGNLAIGTGFTSPTAKLHVRGNSTSDGLNTFVTQNASGSNIMVIRDSRKITVNGGSGDLETFGIQQVPISSANDYRILTVYAPSISTRLIDVYNDGTGVGGNIYVGLGSGRFVPYANANYGSLQLNSYSPSNSFQLFSNRGGSATGVIPMGHIAFIGNTNRGFILDQELSGNLRTYMTNTAGLTSYLLQSDSANQFVAGISTQMFGVGVGTPLSKFEVNGAVAYRSVVRVANDVFDNTFTVMYVDADATTQTLEDATTCKDRLHCLKLRTGIGTSATINSAGGNVEGGASYVLTNTLAGLFNQVWFQSDGTNWNIVGR